MVDKYMRELDLMEIDRNFMDESCSASDAVSIAITNLSNPAYPRSKYSIQFFLAETSQNRLQRLKELGFIRYLSAFEFSFQSWEQVEVTGRNTR
jgi:hypothetical protein